MDEAYRNKWLILAAVSLALFMGTVDGTIVNVDGGFAASGIGLPSLRAGGD